MIDIFHQLRFTDTVVSVSISQMADARKFPTLLCLVRSESVKHLFPCSPVPATSATDRTFSPMPSTTKFELVCDLTHYFYDLLHVLGMETHMVFRQSADQPGQGGILG